MDIRHFLIAPLPLALAACDRPERAPPEPDPIATPAPAPLPQGSPASIMRPSVIEEAKAVEAAPPPAPEPVRVTIGFPEGGATLDAAALAAIDALARRADLADMGPIVLRGHSDAIGSDAANLRVSQRRAEAVRDRLVERGIAEARISIIALGERRPVAPNADRDGGADEAGQRSNRRVEIEVLPPEPAPAPAEQAAEPAAEQDRARPVD